MEKVEGGNSKKRGKKEEWEKEETLRATNRKIQSKNYREEEERNVLAHAV